MAETQRAEMQAALDALTEFTSSMTVGQRYSNTGQLALDTLLALRNALAAVTEHSIPNNNAIYANGVADGRKAAMTDIRELLGITKENLE